MRRRLSHEYSTEGFIGDLASEIHNTRDGGIQHPRVHSRGLAFFDEAGRLFSTMRTKGYAEGLKDVLANAWDAPTTYARKLAQYQYTLRSVFLNIVAATTPSRFVQTVAEDIMSGFLARFLPVWARPQCGYLYQTTCSSRHGPTPDGEGRCGAAGVL